MTQAAVTESRSGDQAIAVKLCARDADGTLYEVAVDKATGALSLTGMPASVGAKAPASSMSVTGSLAAASPTPVADATATNSAVQLGSLAAGPSGIRVQNTSAVGQPNIRVGDSSITTTRGLQLGPGQWEIFTVDNANRLYVIAESGSPTYGVTQA